MAVTAQRDAGILKRTNGTPLPSAVFLGARVIHAMFVAVLLVVITAAFGRAVYSADVPTGMTLVRFLIVLAVGGPASAPSRSRSRPPSRTPTPHPPS